MDKPVAPHIDFYIGVNSLGHTSSKLFKMARNISKTIKQALPDIRKDVLLKDYTTFKIGGPAKYFFNAKNKEDLIKAVKIAKELKLPIFILSKGSKVLISDKGVRGLVMKIDINGIKFQENKALVGAGVDLTKLAYLSAEKGLSGLEWSAGIPGTVGGAIYGNAQAFGDRIADLVKETEALDLKTLKTKKLLKKQCRFSLKSSIFKKNKNLIIISVVLELKNGNKKAIKEKIKEHLNYRKKNHPINYPSAGSVFVNPENKDGIIHTGSLIEKCGLKGKKIGRAQISKKHANFIINLGGAKAKDVLALIKLAKKKVKKAFGVKLETEVQFIGFKNL